MAPAKKSNYDETDVTSALARTTADGSGFPQNLTSDTLPPSDFDGFPEDGVENDHDGDNVGTEEDAK